MEIRKAVLNDVAGIQELSGEFWEESNFAGLEPDTDNWPELISGFITMDIAETFVAVVDEKIVGYLSLIKEKYYTKHPLANMFMFYVKPENRRSSIGIRLLEASIEQAKEWEVCAYYVGISAGIAKTDSSLLNLYRKFGFEDAGTFQRRIF